MVTVIDSFKPVIDGIELDDGWFNASQEKPLSVTHMCRIDDLRLMVAASLTERGSVPIDTARDVFSDSNGYNNLIDTGATTATYDAGNKCYAKSTTSIVQTIALNTAGNNINCIFVQAQRTDASNIITYDVSADNGSNWTTGLTLEIINNITSTAGNDLIIKFNLPADANVKLYGFSCQWGRV